MDQSNEIPSISGKEMLIALSNLYLRMAESASCDAPTVASGNGLIAKGKELSACYTVNDLMQILGLSRPSVYNLLKQNLFPCVQLNNRVYRIPRAPFRKWLEGTTDKEI